MQAVCLSVPQKYAKREERMSALMAGAIPLVILAVALILLFSKTDLFSEFLEGCRDGMKVSVDILPSLVLLICAVSMFRASGALEAVCDAFSPALGAFGLPSELVPVIITRPISGSAATAVVKELFEVSGPDSFAGRAASVLMGSSDTIIYTLSMYFAYTKTKRTRHALPCSFIIMFFCVITSCAITRIFF